MVIFEHFLVFFLEPHTQKNATKQANIPNSKGTYKSTPCLYMANQAHHCIELPPKRAPKHSVMFYELVKLKNRSWSWDNMITMISIRIRAYMVKDKCGLGSNKMCSNNEDIKKL